MQQVARNNTGHVRYFFYNNFQRKSRSTARPKFWMPSQLCQIRKTSERRLKECMVQPNFIGFKRQRIIRESNIQRYVSKSLLLHFGNDVQSVYILYTYTNTQDTHVYIQTHKNEHIHIHKFIFFLLLHNIYNCLSK